MLTHEQKVELYRAGKYRFKAPGVCCSAWEEKDWIAFISAYDGWMP